MKLKNIWLLVAVGIVAVGIVAGLLGNKEDTIIKKIKRPNNSKQVDSYSLTAQVEDEEYAVEIRVEPMKISSDMIQGCFDEAYEIVCEKMRGENEALDRVREDLVFIEEVEKYGIEVSYFVSDYSLISSMGKVHNKELSADGKECEITVNLEYENMLQSYKVRVKVYPPVLTKKEAFEEALNEEIEKNNELFGEEYLTLPTEIGGNKVTFVEKAESKVPIMVIFGLIALVLWYYKTFVIKRNEEKAREEQLQMDYSELVSKLSLLMGAGMSGFNALGKIATDYKNSINNNGKKSVAYEEVVATVNRISSGVSEADSYAIFGRSCKCHCYIKLSSLLIQNVRKGGEEFIGLLKSEVTEAFLERKAKARQKGEEAGTKLLLPMGMMLCVVLVVIIVPAFMSF